MSAEDTSIIKFDNVNKYYSLGKTKVHAVKDVSFALTKGDFVSFSGPSGSGKSTILNMIGCIDTADSGSVTIDSKVTDNLKEEEITNLRHETLGFIFQSFNLIPVLNIYENIEFPLLFGKQTDFEIKKMFYDYFSYFGFDVKIPCSISYLLFYKRLIYHSNKVSEVTGGCCCNCSKRFLWRLLTSGSIGIRYEEKNNCIRILWKNSSR